MASVGEMLLAYRKAKGMAPNAYIPKTKDAIDWYQSQGKTPQPAPAQSSSSSPVIQMATPKEVMVVSQGGRVAGSQELPRLEGRYGSVEELIEQNIDQYGRNLKAIDYDILDRNYYGSHINDGLEIYKGKEGLKELAMDANYLNMPVSYRAYLQRPADQLEKELSALGTKAASQKYNDFNLQEATQKQMGGELAPYYLEGLKANPRVDKTLYRKVPVEVFDETRFQPGKQFEIPDFMETRSEMPTRKSPLVYEIQGGGGYDAGDDGWSAAFTPKSQFEILGSARQEEGTNIVPIRYIGGGY